MTCTLSIYLIAVKDEIVLPKEVEKEVYSLATLKIAFTKSSRRTASISFCEETNIKVLQGTRQDFNTLEILL